VTRPLLAEDCQVAAFAGAPASARWLDAAEAEALLAATPDANVPADIAGDVLGRVVEEFARLQPQIDRIAEERGQALLDAHRRVRSATRRQGVRQKVEVQLPADVLGIFVYLPITRTGN
jgi:hypothetical protein